MKILQIGATFVGAQKKIEYAIHKYVIREGHDSRIMYAIGESDEGDIICYENSLDSVLRRGLRKIFGKNPHFAFISTLKLIREIKKFHPDLIHIHIIHHGYLDYEMLMKYLIWLNKPVVFTVHDMWLFTGGCYYYSSIGCNEFMNRCSHCPKNEKELDCRKNETERCLYKKLSLFDSLKNISFVSVSPWVYSEIKKSHLAKYPQYLVMNSIDKVNDSLPKCKKRDKFTIIGVATNWDDRKGLGRFYELGRKLKGECDILLVGNVAEKLKFDAPSNIIFYGYVNSSIELYDLYSSCNLYVSMSFEETFGLTFIEAALSGIRGMGFSSTAIPVVLKKINGYIISSCTVEEAEIKIRQLLENPKMCEIKKEEYRDIKKYFSPQRMAFEYMSVYEKMFNSK